MKLRRLLRDVTVLIAFCGAFYLLITFVNRLDADSNDEVSDFSVAREEADTLAKGENWESAADEYLKLTKQDPYNGYAWERYAASYYALRFQALKELDTLKQVGVEDPARLDAVREKVKQNGDKSYQIFSKVREFARFRGGALLRMAVIDSYRGNNEEALDLLEEFVDAGQNTQQGLATYRQFGVGGQGVLLPGATIPENCRLHYFPRFWEIVDKERVNRETY